VSDPATPNDLKRPHLEVQYEDPVEASCKSVIGQRLKLSGMHWSLSGADAITTLRCQQASRPEDRIWPAARNQTLAA
jgi:hypothetical protein